MRVVIDGAVDWWQVDIMVRPPFGTGDLNQALVERLRASLPDLDDVPPVVRDPEPTYSFDMSPPEGDLGVAVWVRASSPGRAVDAAWSAVGSELRALTPDHAPQLWDVRLVPASAVMTS